MDLQLLGFGNQFTNNEQHQNLRPSFELLSLWMAINAVKTNLYIVFLSS
jgi:hypothetical protein